MDIFIYDLRYYILYIIAYSASHFFIYVLCIIANVCPTHPCSTTCSCSATCSRSTTKISLGKRRHDSLAVGRSAAPRKCCQTRTGCQTRSCCLARTHCEQTIYKISLNIQNIQNTEFTLFTPNYENDKI